MPFLTLYETFQILWFFNLYGAADAAVVHAGNIFLLSQR